MNFSHTTFSSIGISLLAIATLASCTTTNIPSSSSSGFTNTGSITGALTSTGTTPVTQSGNTLLLSGSHLTLDSIESVGSSTMTGSGNYAFYLDYPVIGGSNISQEIESWINAKLKAADDEIKNSKIIMEGAEPEFQGTFRFATGSNSLSVIYDTYEMYGGANGETEIKTFTIDSHGKKLGLSDVFTGDASAIKNEIIALVKASGTDAREEDITAGVEQFMTSPNFYFENNTLYLVFQKYQVASGSRGVQRIPVKDTTTIKKEFLSEISSGISSSLSSGSTTETPKNSPDTSLQSSVFDIPSANAAENTHSEKKYVALTFDDGPHKINTPKLLDILKKNNVHATFFVLGKNVSYFPDIVKREVAEGHEVGSHSWDHPQLTRLSEGAILAQKNKTDTAIKNATGITPKIVRPPYGSYNATVKRVFKQPIILWDVDTLDWKTRSVTANIKAANTQTHNGSIILFHDIHKSSVDSIDSVIKDLKKKGYTFVTVSELLALGNKGEAVTTAVVCTSEWSCK